MFRVSTLRRFALEGGTPVSPPPHSATQSTPSRRSSFSADRRGNVAIPFALMLTVMCLMTGAAVDLGMWMQARNDTQEAMDAAVLAGLKKYQDTNDPAQAITAAQLSYAFNVKGRTPVKSDTVNFQMINNNTEMQATGDVWMDMKFLVIANVPTLPLMKTDGSENPISQASVGTNAGQSLEVSIMIDNTGSMCESAATAGTGQCDSPSKMDTVIQAANDLVDTVIWSDQGTYTSKIAIIPFDQAVNISTAASITAARGTVSNADPDCVSERLGTHRYDDVSPATAPVGYQVAYSGNCPLAMISLSANKTDLHNLINQMSPGSSTAGHIGTAWAWYALSPNFNGIWKSASSAARPYADLTTLNSHGQPILKKIAVLMTDGDYNTQYCNGQPDFNSVENSRTCRSGNFNDTSLNQAKALCTSMKAKGIEVYTIGAMVSQSAQTFLSGCATDTTHFYNATDQASLQAAFKAITQKLVQLHLTH